MKRTRADAPPTPQGAIATLAQRPARHAHGATPRKSGSPAGTRRHRGLCRIAGMCVSVSVSVSVSVGACECADQRARECVCVSECVRERERDRKSERERYVCVCVCERERERERACALAIVLTCVRLAAHSWEARVSRQFAAGPSRRPSAGRSRGARQRRAPPPRGART